MNPKRQSSGRAARTRGEQFEHDLETSFRPTWVYLQRTSPPWKYVKIGGALKPVVTQEGVPDYHAAVDHHAVIFDAKATGKDRWRLDGLDDAQGRHFTASAGHVTSGVLLRFDLTQRVFWLPWSTLAPWWWAATTGTAVHGESSLTEAMCTNIGTEVHGLRWWDVVKP